MPQISEKREARRYKRKKGFTLIELMIAISIVAIISAIGLVSYSQSQLIARDAKRKQDLRAISVALELYRQNNDQLYPNTNTNNGSGGSYTAGALLSNGANPWITQLTTSYINSVPKDPKTFTGNPLSSNLITGYSYWAGRTSGGSCPSGSSNEGQYYILAAGLENENDPESNKNKSYKDCAGADIVSTSNKTPFIITSQ